jgi:hypothetical protein
LLLQLLHKHCFNAKKGGLGRLFYCPKIKP